ncbi:hypothetical protein [Planktothrix agardhii]|nr:hypothetical protein [Planktothrix agardhii]
MTELLERVIARLKTLPSTHIPQIGVNICGMWASSEQDAIAT